MATGARRPRGIEVVALLASAGGLDALSIVLTDLPAEFPAAIVVMQHLGGQTSVLPTILERRSGLPVCWAHNGQWLTPGRVFVCPPGVDMELMPDGSCRLRSIRLPGERRGDVLLTSLASSYAARGLAVVLSGSGRDGAEGTAEMRQAGALVIAQSPDTAAYPSMPIAAAAAGAALVLPVDEIGLVLTDIAAGAPLLRPQSEADAARAVFDCPGEVCGMLRETDWAATPLGPVLEWPAELRVLVRNTLDHGYPMAVWWGQDEVHVIEEMTERTWDVVQENLNTPQAKTVGVLFFRLDGAIVAINDAVVQLSGYHHNEPNGSGSTVDIAGAEFREAVSAVLVGLYEKDLAATDSDEHRSVDEPWWALSSPLMLDGDTTEKTDRTTRLGEQFRALGRAVGQSAGAADVPAGESQDWQTWERFTGRSIDEWLGWGWVNAAHPVERAVVNLVSPGVGQNRRRPGVPRGCQLMRVRSFPLHRSDGSGQGWSERKIGQNRTAGEAPTDTAAADYAGVTNATADDAVQRAAARAEAARLRAAELRRRREDLATGLGATEQSVAVARIRAEESLRRAQLARLAAAELVRLKRSEVP